ncbi:MAG: hypothetical protein PVH06_09995, partial [Methyloceanibacter sp.]
DCASGLWSPWEDIPDFFFGVGSEQSVRRVSEASAVPSETGRKRLAAASGIRSDAAPKCWWQLFYSCASLRVNDQLSFVV